jgi:hypothetical protein
MISDSPMELHITARKMQVPHDNFRGDCYVLNEMLYEKAVEEFGAEVVSNYVCENVRRKYLNNNPNAPKSARDG